jgi:hypothetical protein
VTRLRAERLAFSSTLELGFFSSPRPDCVWDPSSLIPNGYHGLKWPEREVGQSPLSSVKVKNVWNYTFTPPYVLLVGCLLPRHGTSSGCGWRRRPPDVEVAANVLNKQSRPADSGLPSSLRFGREVNKSSQ